MAIGIPISAKASSKTGGGILNRCRLVNVGMGQMPVAPAAEYSRVLERNTGNVPPRFRSPAPRSTRLQKQGAGGVRCGPSILADHSVRVEYACIRVWIWILLGVMERLRKLSGRHLGVAGKMHTHTRTPVVLGDDFGSLGKACMLNGVQVSGCALIVPRQQVKNHCQRQPGRKDQAHRWKAGCEYRAGRSETRYDVGSCREPLPRGSESVRMCRWATLVPVPGTVFRVEY